MLRLLVQDFPSNVRFRHMLARNQNEVGLLLAKVGRPADAVPALREAVLLMEQLPEAYPNPGVRRWRLADFVKDLAAVLTEHGSWDEASGLLEKAVRLLTAPPSLFPDPVVLASLDESLQLMIRESDKHGTSELAHKTLKEISVTLWSRNDAGMMLAVAAVCAREGLHAEAIAELVELTKSDTQDVTHWYNCACVYALASGKDTAKKGEYATRAVELLQKAVTLGWKDATHIAKDADLDALRGRDDFEKLVESLQMPKPKVRKTGVPPTEENNSTRP